MSPKHIEDTEQEFSDSDIGVPAMPILVRLGVGGPCLRLEESGFRPQNWDMHTCRKFPEQEWIYYRSAGNWSVVPQYVGGRWICMGGYDNRHMDHTIGLEFIPCTIDEYNEDNKGYSKFTRSGIKELEARRNKTKAIVKQEEKERRDSKIPF